MFVRATTAAIAIAFSLSGTVAAQDIAGYKGNYVSGQIGVNDLHDSTHQGTGFTTNANFQDDPIFALAFGRAYGNGFRLEAEYARRKNDGRTVGGATASGDMNAHSLMVNALYDIQLGVPVVPYIGAGLGLARIRSDVAPVSGSVVSGSDTQPAFQAMVGASLAVADNVDLTADLRYFGTRDAELGLASGGGVKAEYNATSFMVGLRWRLGAAPAAPRAEPAAAPAPAPMAEPRPAPQPEPQPKPAPAAVERSFLIFFDWDKSTIRPDTQKILEAAAAAAKQGSVVSIQLTGHADRSGPTRYNQRLSERRAAAAKAVLVKLGVPAGTIATAGKGETQPLVATADGVREPRNRRVEIKF